MPTQSDPLSSMLSAFSIGKFLYDPKTYWEHFFNPQVGVFNVFGANTEDKGVEAAVLHRVGSYGSQLSTIMEVIQLLCDETLNGYPLNAQQKRALQKLKVLWEESQETVALYQGEFSPTDADRFLDLMATLKEREPSRWKALKRHLEEATEAESERSASLFKGKSENEIWVEIQSFIEARAQAVCSSPPTGDLLIRLEKLAILRDRGVISESEFQALKTRLLG